MILSSCVSSRRKAKNQWPKHSSCEVFEKPVNYTQSKYEEKVPQIDKKETNAKYRYQQNKRWFIENNMKLTSFWRELSKTKLTEIIKFQNLKRSKARDFKDNTVICLCENIWKFRG